MADVFISYARADKARVAPLVAAIEARGWSVWWDPEITPGQEFDDQIEAEIESARAVLVVWTPTSVASRWVRGEAREAAERGILVPVRFEQAKLPMDVRAIHTTDLDDWREDPSHPTVRECLHALGAMIARAQAAQAGKEAAAAKPQVPKTPHYSICVLPFVNMSGDSEQEYFSDGITEDIITDLSNVSALDVISRNDSFLYKGKQVEVPKVAQALKVTHVMEGSVRKAGGRVRITAQLIDGTSRTHVWAERYDRDASDIFAIQDEISHAIVKALKLRLLPEEKKAIERHGTESVEAYNLYLMARQIYATSLVDMRVSQAIIRTCARATEIDPNYAQAWALMATAYGYVRDDDRGVNLENGMAAADKALMLDPDLVEAHAAKAYILQTKSSMDEAVDEVKLALKLDSESYEANRAAGRLNYQLHRFEDAIRYYGKTVSLMEADVGSAMMLASSYHAQGDTARMRRAAEVVSRRAEAVLERDPNNLEAMTHSVYALASLGEIDRAKARMNRALLIDPDSTNTRYNFACLLTAQMDDRDAALEMLEPVFKTISDSFLVYAKADPDFQSLHDDPRWQAMVAAAEARLAAAKVAAPPAPEAT